MLRFLADAASIALSLGRYESAMKLFGAVVLMAPNSPIGHEGLASALLGQGDARRATPHARRACRTIADRRTTANAYLTLGKCLLSSGDKTGAVTVWMRARLIDPQGPVGQAVATELRRCGAVDMIIQDAPRLL